MASPGDLDGVSIQQLPRAARRASDDIEAQSPLDQDQKGRRYTFASSNTATSSRETLSDKTWNVEDEALHGYPRLADLIGNNKNYGIYRTFKALNARHLLYQQAKIAYLEHELNDLEKLYEEYTDLHCKAEHLFRLQEPGSPGAKLRSKHEEIAVELQDYNRRLLEQAKIHELQAPDDSFVNSLWNIINSKDRPQWLVHPESAAYAVENTTRKPIQKDLVTLNRAFRQHDAFTRFFTGRVMDWWHCLYSKFRQPDDGVDSYSYEDRAVSRYMRACVMIVAAALPTSSIVALYVIHSEEWRLCFIVLFSGLFAAALSFFTEARSVEVFTASVALASVQVVFVGTAFGNGSQT